MKRTIVPIVIRTVLHRIMKQQHLVKKKQPVGSWKKTVVKHQEVVSLQVTRNTGLTVTYVGIFLDII